MAYELSRGELLAWVNELTNLNLPKVESMGTGSAYCLIVDSVYGDVPLHKVNFKGIHEYEYIHNFKVLQDAFTRHRIDRNIPVDRLVKLKFQDNLEFLQWMRKFWESNFDPSAGGYNAEKRRVDMAVEAKRPLSSAKKSADPIVSNRLAPRTLTASASLASSAQSLISASASSLNSATNPANSAPNALQLAALTKTITELKLSVDEMEKERDFYFNKLRDIEILTQKVMDPVITESPFFKQITEILYTTEDGFEIPHEASDASGVASLASISAQ